MHMYGQKTQQHNKYFHFILQHLTIKCITAKLKTEIIISVTSIHNQIISHIKLVVKNIAKLWPVKFCLCLLLENIH